jgi:Rne/Rng family ribonuclease
MSKEMVISANPHETRVAILEEGQLCEFYVEREKEFALVGSIYKGRVTRVLPGMQSAFVDIGLDGDAFLYVSDFLEDIEEYDQIVTTVEDKVQKMEDQGGQVFTPGTTAPALEPADVESAPAESVPGESQPPAESFAPPAAPPAPASRPSYDRGGFDHRRGGRHEGRSEGRFGRRGGRRGGRPGRGGGGRGGDRDRRFGRELPPSKYAAPRSYGNYPSEPAPSGEGSAPVILPGESLAKYRDRAAGSAAPPASTPEEMTHAPAAPASVESAVEASHPSTFDSRPPYPAFSGPLPGESIARWKTQESAAEEHTAIPSNPHEEQPEEIEAAEMHEADEAHVEHVAEPVEEEAAPALTEYQAATLAAHMTEAQTEQAERELEEHQAAACEPLGTADIAEAEAVHVEAEDIHAAALEESEEEHELEEEEAVAEAEGMIAPPEELEHDEHPATHSSEAENAAAAAENGSAIEPGNALPEDKQPWGATVRSDFRARMQYPRRGRRDDRDRGRHDDRGRRPHHGPPHRHPPRRSALISDLLKQGQEIIVQIAKEPLGKKGARITSHIALPGRYLVYMPTLDHTGVSRKIASAEERARLRHLVSEAKGTGGGGFIVRTAASGAAPEEVKADVEFLMRTWTEIKTRSEQRKAPSLLHRDLNLVERILRDYMSPDFNAIWVDSEEEFAKVVEFMSRFQPGLANRVKLYTKETPVFEEFGIQQEIDKGLRPKVWLKSGGYIVINHTEALVAIDVNTGKFVGKGSTRLEDTIVRTNLEAVKEIVRQMRLRDLGGIIIIDFIDMEERRNREKVMAALEDALRADRAPSKVLRFNEFGLVAITRKRTKQALERTLCQPCPYCTGSGMVKSIPTLCYEIQTEARKMAPELDAVSLTLRVHPEISKALKTRESGLIDELERWTKKSVIIQADPTLHWEQYDIY